MLWASRHPSSLRKMRAMLVTKEVDIMTLSWFFSCSVVFAIWHQCASPSNGSLVLIESALLTASHLGQLFLQGTSFYPIFISCALQCFSVGWAPIESPPILWTPSNTWFFQPTRVTTGLHGLAVFAGFIHVPNTQTNQIKLYQSQLQYCITKSGYNVAHMQLCIQRKSYLMPMQPWWLTGCQGSNDCCLTARAVCFDPSFTPEKEFRLNIHCNV